MMQFSIAHKGISFSYSPCKRMSKRKVGIVGFGHLGQFLAKAILEDPKVGSRLQLAFVWNRSIDKFKESEVKIPSELIINSLDEITTRDVDLIGKFYQEMRID